MDITITIDMNNKKGVLRITYLIICCILLVCVLSLTACQQKPKLDAKSDKEKQFGSVVEGFLIKDAMFSEEAETEYGNRLIVENHEQLQSLFTDPSKEPYVSICERYDDSYFEKKNLAISCWGYESLDYNTIYQLSIQQKECVEQRIVSGVPEVLAAAIRRDLIISEVSKDVDTIIINEEKIFEGPAFSEEKKYGYFVEGFVLHEAGFSEESGVMFGAGVIVESHEQLKSLFSDPDQEPYLSLCEKYGDGYFTVKNLAVSNIGVASSSEETIYLLSVQFEDRVEQRYFHYIPEMRQAAERDDLIISEVSKDIDTIEVNEECLYEESYYQK